MWRAKSLGFLVWGGTAERLVDEMPGLDGAEVLTRNRRPQRFRPPWTVQRLAAVGVAAALSMASCGRLACIRSWTLSQLRLDSALVPPLHRVPVYRAVADLCACLCALCCSCVGVWQNDRVEIIANDQGNRTTPSYVAFTPTERLIGDAAKNQVAMNPTNTVFDAKRLIGRKINDPTVVADRKLWPFKVTAGAGEKPQIEGKDAAVRHSWRDGKAVWGAGGLKAGAVGAVGL